MNATAVATQAVGTSKENNAAASVNNPSLFEVSKENTLQWSGYNLHRIVISEGDAEMLEAGIRGLESVKMLEVRDLDDNGFIQGVFMVGDPEDARPLVYGYNVAIQLFMRGCEKMLTATGSQGNGGFPQDATDVARQHDTRREPQSQNNVYCWNVNADFDGAMVRPSGSFFQVVNHKEEVFADGDKEFCEVYLHTVMDIRGFSSAKDLFESEPGNAGKELWMSRSILDMAKRILQATSPKGSSPELVGFREMLVVGVAVKLAKAALEHGRAARQAQDSAEREARRAAWKNADESLSQVEFEVYHNHVNYAREKKLQTLIRAATSAVNQFSFADLAERIRLVVQPRAGKAPVRDSTSTATAPSKAASAVPVTA